MAGLEGCSCLSTYEACKLCCVNTSSSTGACKPARQYEWFAENGIVVVDWLEPGKSRLLGSETQAKGYIQCNMSIFSHFKSFPTDAVEKKIRYYIYHTIDEDFFSGSLCLNGSGYCDEDFLCQKPGSDYIGVLGLSLLGKGITGWFDNNW